MIYSINFSANIFAIAYPSLVGSNSPFNIKFSVNGVDFLKFRAKELVEFVETTTADIIKFKVVGRAQINEWGGRRTPQIMLDECDYEAFSLEDLF